MRHLFEMVTWRQIQHIQCKSTPHPPPLKWDRVRQLLPRVHACSESKLWGTWPRAGHPSPSSFPLVQTELKCSFSAFELICNGLGGWLTNFTWCFSKYKKNVSLVFGCQTSEMLFLGSKPRSKEGGERKMNRTSWGKISVRECWLAGCHSLQN